MILVLAPDLPATHRNRIRRRLESQSFGVVYVSGGDYPYLEVSGEIPALHSLKPQYWPGVIAAVPVSTLHPHVADRTGEAAAAVAVSAGDLALGRPNFQFIAGPCALEEPDRTLSLATRVRDAGVKLFRGGAFKPRSSPYAFQGLGKVGLELLAQVRSELGLRVVTEVLDVRDLEAVAEIADVLQVGSRNMYNTGLLSELGRLRQPVLLKRGFAATLDEFLSAAETVVLGGNDQLILCERGVRSGVDRHGVVLDLGVVADLRRRTPFPVYVDPSHGAAVSPRVAPLARAAVAAGCDGLLIEVHDAPELALSDGQQAIEPDEFTRLVGEIERIRRALEGARE